MCGIIAYTGTERAVPLLLGGLRRLEYRGYDSAGIAYADHGALCVLKRQGKLAALEDVLAESSVNGTTCGIGHTRWATHGLPTDVNAHPHCDRSGRLAVVHNGIIENFEELRSELRVWGSVFHSETDTEVLAHLIGHGLDLKGDVLKGMRWALAKVHGAYAIAVIDTQQPGTIWAARKGSPLLLGVSEHGIFAASDIPAFLDTSRDVIYLDDDDLAILTPGSWEVVRSGCGSTVDKDVCRIDWDLQAATKDGYPHFMLKEIFEQPRVIRECLGDRLEKICNGEGLNELRDLPVPERINIVACGTSWHAGLWGRYWIERLAGIPVSVEIASEFRYRHPILGSGDLTLAISQSGETADTLAGIRLSREQNRSVLGLCNVVGSSVARESDAVMYTQAGPEISVASTKAMCSQMVCLLLMAMHWGRAEGTLEDAVLLELQAGLGNVSAMLEKSLPSMWATARDLVPEFKGATGCFYLGRGQAAPLALEGALKLKEISYIHAEGYPAGEMKHGPIALVDSNFPTFAIAMHDDLYPKVMSNLKEVTARSGRGVLLGFDDVACDGMKLWTLPHVHEIANAFLVLPAVQLFAYEVAVALGRDVDQPRNLAKSVTVE